MLDGAACCAIIHANIAGSGTNPALLLNVSRFLGQTCGILPQVFFRLRQSDPFCNVVTPLS